MMDLMALFVELADTIMILVTKPFSLLKQSCIFVMRGFCIVVYTWVELLRAAISIHVDIIRRLMIWTFALISLPVRILAALQRERLCSGDGCSERGVVVVVTEIVWWKEDDGGGGCAEMAVVESSASNDNSEQWYSCGVVMVVVVTEIVWWKEDDVGVVVAVEWCWGWCQRNSGDDGGNGVDNGSGGVELQIHLHELQIELENLVWNRKHLEERLHMAIKECRMMEAMLEEVEDEHDEAIVKIELLERQGIKEENLQLKEIQGKGRWSLASQDDAGKGNDHDSAVAEKCISYGIQSFKSSSNGSSTIIQDVQKHKDSWEDDGKTKTELLGFVRTETKASGDTHEVRPGLISRSLYMNEVLVQQREIAILQSLFSAVLSLIVGMIIWEAEDPCMPLVVALFTVVGMSLKSVIQFFSTINNKPVSDAVALLSFNCFILGTLTYPVLPRIAHMSTPMALSFLEQSANWLGFTS
ncbi:hypothetical protein RHMOL_Rhmol07G0174200 [Rhododendron molle]|uniref:Uncharacterized protein n=1 Tax=Rhododendron molle TaxID=49168 RepID=A0ACC0N387_RHOML|nr:hypothetical protein RHMOL_Rhmol07G0174200 [Rhododendron molle]